MTWTGAEAKAKDSSNQVNPSTPRVFQAGQLVLGLLQGCRAPPPPPKRNRSLSTRSTAQQAAGARGLGARTQRVGLWRCGEKPINSPALLSAGQREGACSWTPCGSSRTTPPAHYPPPPPLSPSTYTLGRGKEPVAGYPGSSRTTPPNQRSPPPPTGFSLPGCHSRVSTLELGAGGRF